MPGLPANKSAQPHARRLSELPDLLALHRAAPDAWPFLLASTARDGHLSRWSLLLRAGEGEIVARAGDAGFLEKLRTAWWQARIPASSPTTLPFAGGWFVYLGYETAGTIEPRLRLPPAADRLPVALARRCPGAILIDHHELAAWLVAETPELLEQLSDQLISVPGGDSHREKTEGGAPLQLESDPPEHFIAGVERIREYIRDGDVFQVNLSRGWRANSPDTLDPAEVFAGLSASNAAPFAGLARLPGGTVISSSPERLVEIRGDRIQTRPIAGTRPRGRSASDDQALSRELIAHPKERAEHIMLIDLERNDLGRVCQTGSVEVSELMVIESYAHVHHIVSNVQGRLRDGVTPPEVIAAVFPGGTITGCPKVRCMEIIAELEGVGRSFYTGAMGYLGRDGSLDMNILIRSMAVAGNEITFRTGAGIVADSEPLAELAETEAKARGLLMALGSL